MSSRSPATGERVPASRGHRLLFVVYAVALSMLAVTGVALSVLSSEHLKSGLISLTAESDRRIVESAFAPLVQELDGSSNAASDPARKDWSAIDRAMEAVAASQGLRSIALYTPDGASRVHAAVADESGAQPDPGLLQLAFAGVPGAVLATGDGRSPRDPVLAEYVPVLVDGSTPLVLILERDGTAISQRIAAAGRDLILVIGVAAALLGVLLRLAFRRAQDRIRRQDAAVEAFRRRDQLTGLLNHRAIVAAVEDHVQAASEGRGVLGVVHVDIDNFRLLNEAYGSGAGDEVLLTVARVIEDESAHWAALGRYGPDEFLGVAIDDHARGLEAATARIRARLAGLDLRFGESERLPISVSAGIAYFPLHASNVVELLATAGVALAQAKSSGGGETRIADAWTEGRVLSRFDVFQGLVVAVDTKDRYTKRHSEDVARYAVFLAQRMGLTPQTIEAVRLAGLLHDVGKIGIPDEILRKPTTLTDHEREVVKQHVVLGDLIVRDLPDGDLVRQGIRYHHERWDGTGYVEGLAGPDIPLIARIVSVCDVFSAMTTTRPYRKALTVPEALHRLQEAAGSQLDPLLVATFVEAYAETDESQLDEIERRLLAFGPLRRTASAA